MDTLRSICQNSRLPRLETQMLWQHVLQVPRVWLIAHDTDILAPEAVHSYRQLEARRLAGEPMAYIVGRREFMGYEFDVTPAVLIPRPETELLVETACDFLQDIAAPKVLDLGTGTGAIAVSIALAYPRATVMATDFSAAALAVAQKNAQRLGSSVEFMCGNWYDALAGHKDFDLIVSNPPYISRNDPHLLEGDVRFEPKDALTDGNDGLTALQAIVEGAGQRLRPKGALYMEHGWDQAAAVRRLLQEAGFMQIRSLKDLAGIERISGGIYH